MNAVTKEHEDYKDLVKLVLSVASYNGFAELSDISGTNGDSGLTASRIRKLVQVHGEALGIKYFAGSYKRGNASNSRYFGKCGSGFGGYVPASVSISQELLKKCKARLAKVSR